MFHTHSINSWLAIHLAGYAQPQEGTVERLQMAGRGGGWANYSGFHVQIQELLDWNSQQKGI
jgi:hypothetical protein